MRASLARVARQDARHIPGAVPLVVHEVLRSPGSPLDTGTRAFMEPRFNHDFSGVRVHTDERAAASAQAVNARAYTVGKDMVFDEGVFAPTTVAGRRLLAHELTHVVQQDLSGPATATRPDLAVSHAGDASEQEAERTADTTMGSPHRSGMPQVTTPGAGLQRVETLGTKVTEPTGAKPPFKKVSGTFDGDRFQLIGDGKVIVDADGQSGHPNQVTAADATACRGDPDDSYLNNVRYVGVKDKGPIPEGEFTFLHSNMVTFTEWESARMALAQPGTFQDPSGSDLHGDWGAARVAFKPVKVLPSRFCGSTAGRSGFYLHGGVMTGSSGCIDIGNSAITSVVSQLMGYTPPVHVTVKYTKPAPKVGVVGRAAGRFMYPGKKTGMWDRVKSVFGEGDE